MGTSQDSQFKAWGAHRIAKREKLSAELLERISPKSREFEQELLHIVRSSYKSRDAAKNFQYKGGYMVHNTALQKAYHERRKEMRQNGYSEKEVQDSYAFVVTDNYQQAKRICSEGLKMGNTKLCTLGNPDMAVCVCKHSDLIAPNPFPYGHLCKLVILKIIKGKIKTITECTENGQIDPAPNFDTHISKTANFDLAAVTHEEAYTSSQFYAFEYADYELEQRPRQICPYAVIDVRYVGHDLYKQISKPPRTAVWSNHRSSLPSSSIQAASPRSLPTTSATPSPRSFSRSSSLGSIPSPLVEIQNSPAPQEPLVVWTGQLTSSGTFICLVNMVSQTRNGRPARIGNQLELFKRSPLDVMQARYFIDLQDMPKDSELHHEGLFYNYCRLVPVKKDDAQFAQIKQYLETQQSGAKVKLDDNTEGLVMPTCILIKCLGLCDDSEQFDGLHCIFIANHSRSNPRASDSVPNPSNPSSANGTDATTGYTPPPSVRSGTPDSVGNAQALNKQAILSALSRDTTNSPSPTPSLSSVSSDLPSPGRVELRQSPSPLGHSMSPLVAPKPATQDWDEGFQAFIPPGSLLYKSAIMSSFHEQGVLQDRRNIDIARNRAQQNQVKVISPRRASSETPLRPSTYSQPLVTNSPVDPRLHPSPSSVFNATTTDVSTSSASLPYMPRTNTWPAMAEHSWQQQQQQQALPPQQQHKYPDNISMQQQQQPNLEESPSLGRRPGSPSLSSQLTSGPLSPPGESGSPPTEGPSEEGELSLLDRRILALENGDPDPVIPKQVSAEDCLSPDEDDDDDEEMDDDMVDLIVKAVPLKTFVDPNDLDIKSIRAPAFGSAESSPECPAFEEEESNGSPVSYSPPNEASISEEGGGNKTHEEHESSQDLSDVTELDMSVVDTTEKLSLIPTEPVFTPDENYFTLKKKRALTGKWYSYLKSLSDQSLYKVALSEVELEGTFLRNTEVHATENIVDLKMTFTQTIDSPAPDKTDHTQTSCIQDSINTVLHKHHPSYLPVEESAHEADIRCLWHIGLHFYLKLVDGDSMRILTDKNGNSKAMQFDKLPRAHEDFAVSVPNLDYESLSPSVSENDVAKSIPDVIVNVGETFDSACESDEDIFSEIRHKVQSTPQNIVKLVPYTPECSYNSIVDGNNNESPCPLEIEESVLEDSQESIPFCDDLMEEDVEESSNSGDADIAMEVIHDENNNEPVQNRDVEDGIEQRSAACTMNKEMCCRGSTESKNNFVAHRTEDNFDANENGMHGAIDDYELTELLPDEQIIEEKIQEIDLHAQEGEDLHVKKVCCFVEQNVSSTAKSVGGGRFVSEEIEGNSSFSERFEKVDFIAEESKDVGSVKEFEVDGSVTMNVVEIGSVGKEIVDEGSVVLTTKSDCSVVKKISVDSSVVWKVSDDGSDVKRSINCSFVEEGGVDGSVECVDAASDKWKGDSFIAVDKSTVTESQEAIVKYDVTQETVVKDVTQEIVIIDKITQEPPVVVEDDVTPKTVGIRDDLGPGTVSIDVYPDPCPVVESDDVIEDLAVVSKEIGVAIISQVDRKNNVLDSGTSLIQNIDIGVKQSKDTLSRRQLTEDENVGVSRVVEENEPIAQDAVEERELNYALLEDPFETSQKKEEFDGKEDTLEDALFEEESSEKIQEGEKEVERSGTYDDDIEVIEIFKPTQKSQNDEEKIGKSKTNVAKEVTEVSNGGNTGKKIDLRHVINKSIKPVKPQHDEALSKNRTRQEDQVDLRAVMNRWHTQTQDINWRVFDNNSPCNDGVPAPNACQSLPLCNIPLPAESIASSSHGALVAPRPIRFPGIQFQGQQNNIPPLMRLNAPHFQHQPVGVIQNRNVPILQCQNNVPQLMQGSVHDYQHQPVGVIQNRNIPILPCQNNVSQLMQGSVHDYQHQLVRGIQNRNAPMLPCLNNVHQPMDCNVHDYQHQPAEMTQNQKPQISQSLNNRLGPDPLNQPTYSQNQPQLKSKNKTQMQPPFHPYNRRKKITASEVDKRNFLKLYHTPSDLQYLFGCLTRQNYSSTHLPPGGVMAPRNPDFGRFENYNFVRSQPLDEREEDMEDLPYTEADIPNFEDRRRQAQELDLLNKSFDTYY